MMGAPMPSGGGEARVTPTIAGEQRRAALERKKERLVWKASELATRCDVPVAVICPRVGAGGEPTWWPSKEEAWAIAARYKALPEKDRRKHSVDATSYRENQAAAKQGGGGELASAAQGEGIAAGLGSIPDEELRELLRSIDGSLAAASDRIEKAADEAEQKLSLEHAGALMVDSQDSAPVDMGKKPKPCTAPPAAASGNSVPYDGEHINLGGYMIERDRFEAIWREHAIPPAQSLQPESLPDDDDGEPLWLWSFDDGETKWKRPLRGDDQSSIDVCVDDILERLEGFRRYFD